MKRSSLGKRLVWNPILHTLRCRTDPTAPPSDSQPDNHRRRARPPQTGISGPGRQCKPVLGPGKGRTGGRSARMRCVGAGIGSRFPDSWHSRSGLLMLKQPQRRRPVWGVAFRSSGHTAGHIAYLTHVLRVQPAMTQPRQSCVGGVALPRREADSTRYATDIIIPSISLLFAH